jgi:glutathione S-transferase
MKLYYATGSCSLGIHVLLEEIGQPYELQPVDLRAGAQFGADYMAINPKSKVPALQLDDGTVLTEWPAIAVWLAVNNMSTGLLPMDAMLIARIMEAVTYINSTIHLQGFMRIFRSATFSENAADKDAIKAKGFEIFLGGLALMNETLGDKEYIAGEFSIADAALFYVAFWGKAVVKKPLPPAIDAHYTRMLTRPAVQRVMQSEGLV